VEEGVAITVNNYFQYVNVNWYKERGFSTINFSEFMEMNNLVEQDDRIIQTEVPVVKVKSDEIEIDLIQKLVNKSQTFLLNLDSYIDNPEDLQKALKGCEIQDINGFFKSKCFISTPKKETFVRQARYFYGNVECAKSMQIEDIPWNERKLYKLADPIKLRMTARGKVIIYNAPYIAFELDKGAWLFGLIKGDKIKRIEIL
jgi:hypothetical protein